MHTGECHNGDMTTASPPRFGAWWIWVVLPLLGWWTYGLFDLDEGFYAAVTGEMIRRGEWITPYYNGQPWFEKPILLYWLAKPCIMAFGDAVGPRLPSIVAQLLLCTVVFRQVGALRGQAAGIGASLAVGSTLVLVALGRMMMTDAWLILSLSAVFLLFYRSLEVPEREVGLRAAAGVWLGLSVLAKGPVGCILFVLAIAAFAWIRPDLRQRIRGRWAGWMAATFTFLAVVAAWYVPSLIVNGQLFVDKFLIEQNIGRFAGGDKAHAVPFFAGLALYPLVLALGTLPWNFTAFRTFATRREDPFVHYCWVWGSTIFWFFLVGGSKLPHYIAPACVPIAILAGMALRESPAILQRRAAVTAVVVFLVANAGFYAYYQGWLGGPSHAQIHRAILAVPKGAKVATYQITRRNKDLGTGQLKVQETSHPSLAFYADQPVVDIEDPESLSALPAGTYVLTRPDREIPVGWVDWKPVAGVDKFRLGILREP